MESQNVKVGQFIYENRSVFTTIHSRYYRGTDENNNAVIIAAIDTNKLGDSSFVKHAEKAKNMFGLKPLKVLQSSNTLRIVYAAKEIQEFKDLNNEKELLEFLKQLFEHMKRENIKQFHQSYLVRIDGNICLSPDVFTNERLNASSLEQCIALFFGKYLMFKSIESMYNQIKLKMYEDILEMLLSWINVEIKQ